MSASMKIVSAILFFMFAVAGCTAQTPASAIEDEKSIEESTIEKASEEQMSYKRITPDEAKAKMTGDVIILDVRTSEEFDAGRVPNAILLPDYEIKEKAGDLLPDKNQTILVYCRSGRRSQAASMELIGMGYTQIYDFGGIIDWTGEIEN